MEDPSNGRGPATADVVVATTQPALFPDIGPDRTAGTPKPRGGKPDSPAFFKTVVIKRGSKLDGLFKGGFKFQGISFVATPAVVLELFNDHKFNEVELILGADLTPGWRDEFSKNRAILERLTELMAQGKLRLFVPKTATTIHTKLYFLEKGENVVRFISTSSNFTRTGVTGAQVNHAIYADLPADDPFLAQLLDDYRQHRELCEPFLGDLMELMRKENDRARAIDAWLAAGLPDADVERNKISADLLKRSLDALEIGSSTVALELPQNADAARHLQKTLVDPTKGRLVDGRTYAMEPAAVVGQFQKHLSGMPLMRLDPTARRLTIWADGRFIERAAQPAEAAVVGRGLEHLERYVETVRFGKTADPDMARAAIWEALLALLSAPFAHEEMKGIRQRYSTEVVSRGPSILCIHGPSHNGKTTILKFALKVMCGFSVEPLAGNQFTPARVRSTTSLGNLFPLFFDDIPTYGSQALEAIVKSHWEKGWSREVPHPQLVITTNREAFKTWAKTRMKKLAFDIEYASQDQGTRTLTDLFRESTDFFPGFAYLYLDSLSQEEQVDLLDDPLARARLIIRRLYELAGRSLPQGFTNRPFEQLFDHEKSRWRDVLRLGQARIVRKHGQLCVQFDAGFQPHDVAEYQPIAAPGRQSAPPCPSSADREPG